MKRKTNYTKPQHEVPTSVPYGYCHCGCGEKTQIIPRTRTSIGNIKGEPYKFIQHHRKRAAVLSEEVLLRLANSDNIPAKGEPSLCHPDKPTWAKGLCVPCYNAHSSGRTMAKCHPERFCVDIKTGSCKNCWKKLDSTKEREKIRARLLKYGLTEKDFDVLYASQEGKCAICGRLFSSLDHPPHTDHEHTEKGSVRGLLCFTCNTGLGSFKDSIELLVSAIWYLNTHNLKIITKEETPFVHLLSGKKFYHQSPSEDDVCIEDIAHNLSQVCRFNGAVKFFYSVAEHCVRVSYLCSPKNQLCALLHDGSEFVASDICRPYKYAPGMSIYRRYESNIQKTIYNKFGIQTDEPLEVKEADNVLLITEKRDLFIQDCSWAFNKSDGLGSARPLPIKIDPWSSEQAERQFLMRFYELTGTKEFYKER